MGGIIDCTLAYYSYCSWDSDGLKHVLDTVLLGCFHRKFCWVYKQNSWCLICRMAHQALLCWEVFVVSWKHSRTPVQPIGAAKMSFLNPTDMDSVGAKPLWTLSRNMPGKLVNPII